MKNKSKEERFETIHCEPFAVTGYTSGANVMCILKDKQTGVRYLFARNQDAGGLTPLLDANGKPIVDKGSE